MSEPVGQAMEQALAYHRAPARLSGAQGRQLPDGMITLLRLAGGDQAMAQQCSEASGETRDDVVAAAVFFIQQVMFAPGGDSYRMLGVEPGADDARIKEHYRWLVRWLHPDRNTDDWDSVYADRVNVAWQDLRLPDRRAAYDRSRQAGATAADDEWTDEIVAAAAATTMVRPAMPDEPPVRAPRPADEPAPAILSAGTAQKLPTLVLGGLGGLAVALLFMMWLAADTRPVEMASQSPRPATGAEASARLAEVEQARALAVPARVAVPMPDETVTPLTVADAPAAPSTERAATPIVTAAAPPAVAATTPPPLTASDPPSSRPVLPAPAPPPTPRIPLAPLPSPAAPTLAGATPDAATAPSPPPPVLREADAHALLQRFSAAYAAGDINALMRLFTRDARNNRGGRDAIVFDYQSLFSASESRELRLQPSGWMQREEGATLLASYEARVQTPGRRRAEVSRGDIRFDIRLENGEARISLVRHD